MYRMNIFLVYAWIDNTGNPFYVGYSKNLKQRTRKHKWRMNSGVNLPYYNKLKKLLKAGHKWIIKIVENNLSEKNVKEREIFWIAYYKKNGVKLHNLTNGGDGATGFTAEQIKKISEKNKGKKRSEETRKKMSLSRIGMTFSEEHKKNLSVARKKRITKDETRKKCSLTSKGKINIKKFKVIDPSGKEYITDHGLTLFCEQNNLCNKSLSAIACGKKKNYRGWTCEKLT